MRRLLITVARGVAGWLIWLVWVYAVFCVATIASDVAVSLFANSHSPAGNPCSTATSCGGNYNPKEMSK